MITLSSDQGSNFHLCVAGASLTISLLKGQLFTFVVVVVVFKKTSLSYAWWALFSIYISCAQRQYWVPSDFRCQVQVQAIVRPVRPTKQTEEDPRTYSSTSINLLGWLTQVKEVVYAPAHWLSTKDVPRVQGRQKKCKGQGRVERSTELTCPPQVCQHPHVGRPMFTSLKSFQKYLL